MGTAATVTAGIILEQFASTLEGSFDTSADLNLPAFCIRDTGWVTIGDGSFTNADWNVEGQLQILWRD